MTYITNPVVDLAEKIDTGTKPRTYLKKLIGEKLELFQNYVIINDNNGIHSIDDLSKEAITTTKHVFLDLSQNPFSLEKLNEIKSLLDLSSQHLHVIVGAACFLDGYQHDNNESFYYSSFFHTPYTVDDMQSFDNIPTIKFSSLNSVPRIHRIIFVNNLYRQGIFDKLMLSFSYNVHDYQKEYLTTKFFLGDIQRYSAEYKFFNDNILQLCPIIIKSDYESYRNSIDTTILSPAYNNTALNIITETTYNEQFFTEKTWKAIYAKQLFLLISAPGSVERLRNFGFDTYDDIIDHSYDNELDLEKRIFMVVNEIKRLEPNILELHQLTIDRRYKNFFYLQNATFESKVDLIKCPLLV